MNSIKLFSRKSCNQYIPIWDAGMRVVNKNWWLWRLQTLNFKWFDLKIMDPGFLMLGTVFYWLNVVISCITWSMWLFYIFILLQSYRIIGSTLHMFYYTNDWFSFWKYVSTIASNRNWFYQKNGFIHVNNYQSDTAAFVLFSVFSICNIKFRNGIL